MEGSFKFAEEPVLTYDDPDEVEFLDNPDENEYNIRITTPGVYFFTIEAADSENNTYTNKVAIEVLDKAELDAFLRTKWDGMRQALIDANIAKASACFTPDRAAAYYDFFQALPNDQIENIIPGTQKMEFIEAYSGKVRYVTEIDIVVNEEPVTISSYIIFVRDNNGIWRIEFF